MNFLCRIVKLSLATSIVCCSTLNAQELDKYADIEWKAKDIPAEKNGLPALSKFFDRYDEELRTQFTPELVRSIAPKKKRAALFSKLEHLYEDLDKALALPHIYDTSEIDFDNLKNEVIYTISLHSVLQLRTFVAIDNGDLKRAKESLEKEFELVRKLGRDRDQFISYLVCNAIEGNALRSIEYILHSELLDEEAEQLILKKLSINTNTRTAFEKVLKHEFLYSMKFLDLLERDGLEKCLELIAGLDQALSFWQIGTDLSNPTVKAYWLIEFVKIDHKKYYRELKTLDLFAEQARLSLKQVKLPLVEVMKLPRALFGDGAKHCPEPSCNWIGEYLANPYNQKAMIHQYVRSYVNQQSGLMIGTLNGLRKYKKKHGKLPKTLQDLVPRYIESVPKDIFSPTGAKIQYDQKRGMIWSVGTDGKTGEPKEQIREKGWLSLGVGPAEEIQMFVDAN